MKKIFSKTTILITLFISLLMIGSCKKYLNEKPNDKLAVPTTIDDLQALLDDNSRMNLKTTPNLGDASSDDYFLLESTFNSLATDVQRIYTWSISNYFFPNDWSAAYIPVYNANFCLSQLQAIGLNSSSSTEWKNVYGSALFFRSYNFLNLLWVYAKAYDSSSADHDLGIVLRESSDFNIPSYRSSVKDCYNKVLADTKEAADNLPSNPIHVMRPSKAAAYGLIARAYLSMRMYDSAYKYADLCLNIKNDLIDFNGDADILGSVNAAIPFKQFNKETIFYTEMTTYNYINAPFRAKIDTALFTEYSNDDLRKAAYFQHSGGYYQFKGSYTGNNSQLFTGIATDEMFLIRAECHARAGRVTDGMNDLNTLMKKRWTNTVAFPVFTATNAADALQQILKERRKELYMRGLRWIDIKRLNKENAGIVLTRKIAGQTYVLQPNADYYALPLPKDIVEQAGIPQN